MKRPEVGVCLACSVNRSQCGWRPVSKGEHVRVTGKTVRD